MKRAIVLFVAVCTVSCLDGSSPDSRSGPMPPVAQAWDGCPWGSDCPEYAPCDQLGETDCPKRSDCEAVYDPTSTTPKFVGCRDKIGPACRAEGEVCSTGDDTIACCPGLYCCGDGLSTAEEHCFAACPI